jgi:hypothetical protein
MGLMALQSRDEAVLPTDDRSYVLYTVIGVLSTLTVTFVGLRVYSRHWLSGQFGADDWMTLVSTVCSQILYTS